MLQKWHPSECIFICLYSFLLNEKDGYLQAFAERPSSDTQQKSKEMQNKTKLLKTRFQFPTSDSRSQRDLTFRAVKWQQWEEGCTSKLKVGRASAFPLKPFSISFAQSPMGASEKQDYECGLCTSRLSISTWYSST